MKLPFWCWSYFRIETAVIQVMEDGTPRKNREIMQAILGRDTGPSAFLYPVLIRLERLGWLTSFWGESVPPMSGYHILIDGKPPRPRIYQRVGGEDPDQ